MTETEAYLGVLEEGYFEVTEAFGGLVDAHVWQRPAEGLLSVGELTGHIAYWEAIRLAGASGENPPDLSLCRVSSALIDARFAYYPTTLATPPSPEQQAMTAEQVCQELVRVHKASVADFTSRNPDLDSTPPGWPSNRTYRSFLTYLVIHIAYHTGQMYSARHLLGEQTPDN